MNIKWILAIAGLWACAGLLLLKPDYVQSCVDSQCLEAHDAVQLSPTVGQYGARVTVTTGYINLHLFQSGPMAQDAGE